MPTRNISRLVLVVRHTSTQEFNEDDFWRNVEVCVAATVTASRALERHCTSEARLELGVEVCVAATVTTSTHTKQSWHAYLSCVY